MNASRIKRQMGKVIIYALIQEHYLDLGLIHVRLSLTYGWITQSQIVQFGSVKPRTHHQLHFVIFQTTV